jgi:NitT/TauT family transport system permease protein
MKPYLLSACGVSLGISWKAGIAAEIIGIPSGSIGQMFYNAKIYFNTVDLFAWTVIVVLVSVLFEKFFLALLGAFFGRLEKL